MSPEWSKILRAGVQAQKLVPGAVCVGGTAAALYAGHRLSYDTDHLETHALESLLKLDRRYGEMQTFSVALEVAKTLSAAAPFDLNEAELPVYKGLAPKWHHWGVTRSICQRLGGLLGEALLR